MARWPTTHSLTRRAINSRLHQPSSPLADECTVSPEATSPRCSPSVATLASPPSPGTATRTFITPSPDAAAVYSSVDSVLRLPSPPLLPGPEEGSTAGAGELAPAACGRSDDGAEQWAEPQAVADAGQLAASQGDSPPQVPPGGVGEAPSTAPEPDIATGDNSGDAALPAATQPELSWQPPPWPPHTSPRRHAMPRRDSGPALGPFPDACPPLPPSMAALLSDRPITPPDDAPPLSPPPHSLPTPPHSPPPQQQPGLSDNANPPASTFAETVSAVLPPPTPSPMTLPPLSTAWHPQSLSTAGIPPAVATEASVAGASTAPLRAAASDTPLAAHARTSRRGDETVGTELTPLVVHGTPPHAPITTSSVQPPSSPQQPLLMRGDAPAQQFVQAEGAGKDDEGRGVSTDEADGCEDEGPDTTVYPAIIGVARGRAVFAVLYSLYCSC